MKRALPAVLCMLCFAMGLKAQNPSVAYFVDTTGKSYTKFSTTSLPTAATLPVTCFAQAGGSKTSISVADDLGQTFALAPNGTAWDSPNNQGVTAFYGLPGGKVFTATAASSVNYVTLACVPVNVGPFDRAGSAVATKLALGASLADVVISFIAEDSTSTGDTFAPGAGYALLKNDGAHGVALAIGAGDPAFSLSPSGKSALIAAVAFQPNVAPSTHPIALNVKLLWNDGSPVVGTLTFQQAFGGTLTTIATLPLDATGAAQGSVPINLQQGDPIVLQVTMTDSSGSWPMAWQSKVNLSMFSGVNTLNFAGTIDKATKLLVKPMDLTTQ
jgi:hypothetical protein